MSGLLLFPYYIRTGSCSGGYAKDRGAYKHNNRNDRHRSPQATRLVYLHILIGLRVRVKGTVCHPNMCSPTHEKAMSRHEQNCHNIDHAMRWDEIMARRAKQLQQETQFWCTVPVPVHCTCTVCMYLGKTRTHTHTHKQTRTRLLLNCYNKHSLLLH